MENYEEKYKQALERARKLATDLPNGRNDRLYHVDDLEYIFSELAESEDDRIRKDIISFVEQAIDAGYGIIDKERKNKWIAWLEKQGEQKPIEWDESIIDETISLINTLASGYGEKVDEPITFNGVKMINNIKERLRAIKPQPKKNGVRKMKRCLL